MATLPQLGLCLAVPPLPLQEQPDLAQRAERAGAAVLAVGEARYDSFATATIVAGATSTVPVLTAVTTWVRSPVATAVAALTVAEASGGRFTLGLGTMPPSWNRDYHGINPSRPLARMREYVAALRAALSAWADDLPTSLDGSFRSRATVCTDLIRHRTRCRCTLRQPGRRWRDWPGRSGTVSSSTSYTP